MHAIIGHETQAHAGDGSEGAQVHQAVAVEAIVTVFAAVGHKAAGRGGERGVNAAGQDDAAVKHLPSQRTNVMSRTMLVTVASMPRCMPEPCVPVAMAPAIVTCVSEGRFGRAKPDPFRERMTSVNVAPVKS